MRPPLRGGKLPCSEPGVPSASGGLHPGLLAHAPSGRKGNPMPTSSHVGLPAQTPAMRRGTSPYDGLLTPASRRESETAFPLLFTPDWVRISLRHWGELRFTPNHLGLPLGALSVWITKPGFKLPHPSRVLTEKSGGKWAAFYSARYSTRPLRGTRDSWPLSIRRTLAFSSLISSGARITTCPARSRLASLNWALRLRPL